MVKEINADKTMVVVHFSRFCRGTGEYVAEKKDTDNIEEARQGYVYFHLKKENIDVKAPTSRKDEVFKVNDPNIAETLRAAQLNWKLKVAQVLENTWPYFLYNGNFRSVKTRRQSSWRIAS